MLHAFQPYDFNVGLLIRYLVWYHVGADVGRIRRGGYIFEFWVGDHPPRHVHIFKDRMFVAKVELDEAFTVMEGKVSRHLRKILKDLALKGKL